MFIGCAALAAAVVADTSSAAEVIKFEGNSSWASASFLELEGCTNTNLYLSAYDDLSQRSSGAFIQLLVSDACTNPDMPNVIIDGLGFTELRKNDFTIYGPNASLNTTIQVTNYLNGEIIPIQINVRWSATDAVKPNHYIERSRSSSYSYFFKATGGGDATAEISGTIWDGQTNLANLPLNYAGIIHSSFMTLEIYR